MFISNLVLACILFTFVIIKLNGHKSDLKWLVSADTTNNQQAAHRTQ